LGDIATAAAIGAVGRAVSGITLGAVGTVAVAAAANGLGNVAGQLTAGEPFSWSERQWLLRWVSLPEGERLCPPELRMKARWQKRRQAE
jgi:hypothetical protein